MTNYAEYQVETAPTWLRRPWGEAWNYVLGLAKDAVLEAAKRAVKVRFASDAPDDALEALLHEYDLPGAYNETPAVIRTRIRRAWASWELAGTRLGLLAALRDAGYPNVAIEERITGRWWEFRIIITTPFPWDLSGVVPLVLGTGWALGSARLTAGAPEGEQARVLAIIHKWKPAHARLDRLSLLLDGPRIGEFTLGDGTVIRGTLLHWSL